MDYICTLSQTRTLSIVMSNDRAIWLRVMYMYNGFYETSNARITIFVIICLRVKL